MNELSNGVVFVSERITNMSDLESYLKDAKMYFDILKSEMKKAAPSPEVIDSAVCVVSIALENAANFEFCIEKRKCNFK